MVAEALIRRRASVRVIVRAASQGYRWRALGAEVVVADIDDSASLAEALRGAAGAYLMVPPDLGASDLLASRKRVIDGMAGAAERARVPQIVFLSGIGAHQPDSPGPVQYLRYGEQRLAAVRTAALTVLRPAGFMENWQTVAHVVLRAGVLPSALTLDSKIPMVSAQDIGATVAGCLLSPPARGSVIELAGPEEYSPLDVAAAASAALRRPIATASLTGEELVEALSAGGASAHVAEAQRAVIDAINAGLSAWERPDMVARGIVTLDEAVRRMLGTAAAA
jgi:uncharacterized protein YbjT (DUF2867 family)